MSITDETENLLDDLSERINPNGWRVISNPTQQPNPKAEELKTLIQTMQGGRLSSDERKAEETEPPEAA